MKSHTKMEPRRLSMHSDSSVEPMDISARTTASTTSGATNHNNSSSSLLLGAHSDASAIELYDEHIRHHHHQLQQQQHHINLRRSTDNDNDEHDDDDDDEGEDDDDIDVDEDAADQGRRLRRSSYKNVMRRDNLRQWDGGLRKKTRRSGSLNNNNNNNHNSHNNNGTPGDCAADEATNGVDLRRLKTDAIKTVATDGKYPCPICDRVSSSQHEFTEHIRGHNVGDTQNFTCKICMKVCIVAILSRSNIC